MFSQAILLDMVSNVTVNMFDMGRPRIVPEKAELERMLQSGMTHADIVAHIYDTTGERVSRTTVSAAISRAGLSQPQPRHETIPWRVKAQHLRDYQARMLRLLGRRMGGQSLNREENKRLSAWLEMLEDDHAVVAYDPDAGFAYIERQPEDPEDMPIHIQLIRIK
jgi:hypothetical protein